MSKKSRKKLHELDPESQEYWERVLQYHGLGLNRGNSHKLKPVGGSTDLEKEERKIVNERNYGDGGGRRVKPKGAKPEK